MKNKIYSIAFFLLLSATSCAKKSESSSSQEEPNKPITEEQKPNLENPDEFDLEILNGKKSENFSNIEMKDLKFGENIFNSNCILENKGFKHCDFNKVNLNHYSTKKKNEYNFMIKYEFKDCNFDYLNVLISSSRNSHKIISGSNTLNLTGDSLKINDTYVWDTKTNIYSPTCSFIIQNIQVSLIPSKINELERYIKIANENKLILKINKKLKDKYESLNSLVNQINSNNIFLQSDAIEQNLKQSLSQMEDILWKSIIEMVLLDISIFKSENINYKNEEYESIKNKISKIIQGLIIEINIDETNEIVNKNTNKALDILNELSSYPDYNYEQFNKYKNLLNTL